MQQEVRMFFETNENGEVVTRATTRTISRIKVKSLTSIMKTIEKTFSELQQDEGMDEFMEYLFAEDAEEMKEAMENPEEAMKNADQEFYSKIFGGFQFLAGKLPERAIELIAVASDIPKHEIDEQEFETLFDIYDAVLEVNDLPVLIERIKKSFSATKRAMKWKNKVADAVGAKTQTVSATAQQTRQ